MNETRGFQCLGHSNWTICSPSSPFYSKRFATFFSFILGGQFLLPQRANNGKGGFIQLQNWMRQRGFIAWSWSLLFLLPFSITSASEICEGGSRVRLQLATSEFGKQRRTAANGDLRRRRPMSDASRVTSTQKGGNHRQMLVEQVLTIFNLPRPRPRLQF